MGIGYNGFKITSIINEGFFLSNRIKILKEIMITQGFDAFLIPRGDMFSGEEVPESEERLKYISKFSGSAGYGIISSNPNVKSVIFSDGRYQLQMKKEIDITEFDIYEGGIAEIGLFLNKNKENIINIAIDPWLITLKQYDILKNILEKNNFNLHLIAKNLIDEIWIDKKIEIQQDIFKLPIKNTGKKSSVKIHELIKSIEEHRGDYYILFRPTGLAWLLNIRGKDLKHTPISRSFCIVSKNGEIFIFSNNKSFKTIINKDSKIYLYKLNEFFSFLKLIKNKVFLLDDEVLPIKIYEDIKSKKQVLKKIECPIEKYKAIKNTKELNGFKIAHLKDGLAFIKLLLWFDKNVRSNTLSEIMVANKLLELRSLEKTFVCESFSTISAFNDNGAIIHYKASKVSDKKIIGDGLYLLDTGGQYLEGTTDTTRTILVGKSNSQMILDYTLVLKGHIALAQAIFPEGTKGRELDSLARKSLWSEGKDYAHGTGHGVGCFLSVHEGPVSISKNSDCIIKSGMVISNEPGYYKSGAYGIRIENLEVVSKKYFKNNKDSYLYFENLTRVPIEINLINKQIMSKDEICWINSYHDKVYKELRNLIDSNDTELLNFLKFKTTHIKQ